MTFSRETPGSGRVSCADRSQKHPLVETEALPRLLRLGIMLDGHVLVLNRVFQAIQITSVRRGLTLLYKGHVRAVDSEYRTYDFVNWADIPVQPTDNYVRTPNRIIKIPHVVQLL